LRALLRLADFALRSLARPCTFDPFLRLAMIGPLWLVCVTSYPSPLQEINRIHMNIIQAWLTVCSLIDTAMQFPF
jgi:hypothetical protein